MGLADVRPMLGARPLAQAPAVVADVAVLEDEPESARLAEELCEGLGLRAITYAAPGLFLSAFAECPPRLVVLDWRFEREVGAAVFLAVRHRFGDVPIVCWTATPASGLPAMVIDDARVRVVAKGSGLEDFEAAVRWALAEPLVTLEAEGAGP